MERQTIRMSGSDPSGDDEILQMFFDEGFVPYAFVDILLSSAASKDATQVQAASSSLLSRLDFYTKNLTKELEMTIQRLEKLSETLPGTWSVKLDKSDEESESPSAVGSSKLEYYLDTLSSAIRVLEADMSKIDLQLSDLDSKYESSGRIVEKLQRLEKIKSRLYGVLMLFKEIKRILNLSTNSVSQNNPSITSNLVTVEDFKKSLNALQNTICQTLIESAEQENVLEKNNEVLEEINFLTKLKPMFKGLEKFYPLYSDFVGSIQKQMQDYLSTKDIGSELNV